VTRVTYPDLLTHLTHDPLTYCQLWSDSNETKTLIPLKCLCITRSFAFTRVCITDSPPDCPSVTFWHCVRRNVLEIEMGPKNWGSAGVPLGWDDLDLYKHASPIMGYHAEFDRFWSNGTGVRIRRKKLAPRRPRPAFQGHSGSSEPTLIDEVSRGLLTFFSNRWLVPFQDIARYWPKISHFSKPTFIYRPRGGRLGIV